MILLIGDTVGSRESVVTARDIMRRLGFEIGAHKGDGVRTATMRHACSG